MKLFDAHIYSDARTDGDFANLAFFGVERTLTCAHAAARFETAQDLWAYFERLIFDEPARLARFQIQAHTAIGIHPRARPRRAHYEIWRELPTLLALPQVAALGELGLSTGDDEEWSLIERQLRILVDCDIDKPIVFALPWSAGARRRTGWLAQLGALVRDCGIDPARVLVQHMDWLAVDEAEAQGFTSGLSVHPFYLSPQDAVRIVQHHDRRRLIASAALRDGPSDVVALPKLAVALTEAEIPRGDIERILYGNAMALFVR